MFDVCSNWSDRRSGLGIRTGLKMYTFVTDKFLSVSMRYPVLMYTYVYRVEKVFPVKSYTWPDEMSTFVYFYIPFMSGADGFCFGSSA